MGKYAGTYFSSLAGSTDRVHSRGDFTAKQTGVCRYVLLFKCQTEDLRLEGLLQPDRQVCRYVILFKCQPEDLWLEGLLQNRQVSMQARTYLHWQGQQTQGSQQGRFYCKAGRQVCRHVLLFKCQPEDLRQEGLLQNRQVSMQTRTSLHWQGQHTQGSQQGRFYCKADR